eukprot:Skav204566  [mRNA]  locus=scaffold2218:25565:27802:- [translate_table: standard]
MDSSGHHGRSLQQTMAGRSRISKESFADMVASSGSKVIRGTMPHSLRGMAFGQLQHLHTLFVQSGWLDAQCELFNRENAQAIENGEKFKQSSNLYAMDSYVIGPMTKPGLCAARQHDVQHSIAEAYQTSSFSELVNPHGLIVHVFVSHYWGHDFTSTVTALRLWAEQRMTSEKAALVESMEAMVFWICLFALNQHQKAEELGGNPQQGPFNAALAQARDGAVMVLDEDIRPFSRVWCLFEISRLKELRTPFELISREGSLSKPVILGSQAAKMLEAACEALWTVSIVNAQSSVDADRFQIWAEAVDKGLRPLIAGIGAQRFFRPNANREFLVSYFSEFDHYMRSLLSTTLLPVLLANGDYARAGKCLFFGAQVGPEQLEAIRHSLACESGRRAWLAGDNDGFTALMAAARGGHVAVAKLLLDRSADVGSATSIGQTALMRAARGGHEAVAKLLLEHGADVRSATTDGETALMIAAEDGHEAVAKLLLEHGADVGSAATDVKPGFTALMAAAQGGHEAVAKLLLKHGADVRSASTDGETALMLAARGGHVAVAKLLLEHGADVGSARIDDGFTALIVAARGGHEAVAKLLLEHGADVKSATVDGRTALTCAANGAHQAVAQLLLEHGAEQRSAPCSLM